MGFGGSFSCSTGMLIPIKIVDSLHLLPSFVHVGSICVLSHNNRVSMSVHSLPPRFFILLEYMYILRNSLRPVSVARLKCKKTCKKDHFQDLENLRN